MAGVLESVIFMLYELLHKRCVSFLQCIHYSLFMLFCIILLQVSHVAGWLGFFFLRLAFGIFLGFSGPRLSFMSPESMNLCADFDLR